MPFLFTDLGFPPEQCLCENCRDIKEALSDSIPLVKVVQEPLIESEVASGKMIIYIIQITHFFALAVIPIILCFLFLHFP